jgi:tetratricopeptide (TPR) repeat protein
MPPTSPKSQGAQKRQTSTATWIVTGVVVVGIIVAVIWVLNRRSHAAEYNRIVDTMINEGNYEDAVPALEKYLAGNPPEDMVREAREQLARCYLHLGDKDELSIKQRAEWFRKAEQVDPSVLEDRHRQELQIAEHVPVADDADDSDADE